MTGLVQQAAARGVSLLRRARVAVDDAAIRQMSFGWERPSLELRAAWVALHPVLAARLVWAPGPAAPPMDEWVDMVAVDEASGWDDDDEDDDL